MNQTTLTQRRRPMQARGHARYQQILDTAEALLSSVGLDRLTTNLIARESKIPIGAIYHFFPNKYSILHALTERLLSNLSEQLQHMAECAPLHDNKLKTLSECLTDFYLEHHSLIAALPVVVQEEQTRQLLRKYLDIHAVILLPYLQQFIQGADDIMLLIEQASTRVFGYLIGQHMCGQTVLPSQVYSLLQYEIHAYNCRPGKFS